MRKAFGKRLAVGVMTTSMLLASAMPAFAAEGWMKNEKGWWYEYDNGSYPVNSWQMVKDVWYHFDNAGYMNTGWVLDNDGRWYFTNSDGAMLTGWVVVDNKGYYLNPISNGYKGAMATGTTTIDGVEYTFDASGACVTAFPHPTGAYYGNGVKVSNAGGNRVGGSGSSSNGGSTTVNKELEELNNTIAEAVKDVKEVKVDKVTGTDTARKVTVTVVDDTADILTLQPVVESIINPEEVATVTYGDWTKSVEDAKAQMEAQFAGRTLDTIAEGDYTATLKMADGTTVVYTVTIK